MKLTDKQVAELEAKAAKYEKMKAINKKAYERRNAKINILLRKAKAAGITVTNDEIDKELAGRK